jgi:hypothetical protein
MYSHLLSYTLELSNCKRSSEIDCSIRRQSYGHKLEPIGSQGQYRAVRVQADGAVRAGPRELRAARVGFGAPANHSRTRGYAHRGRGAPGAHPIFSLAEGHLAPETNYSYS